MKKKTIFIFLLILVIHSFFRFYQLDSRSPFGWDQVDNAWAAKNIIVDHKLPLLGFQAKLNSGIFIGPLYYYLIAPFYFLTGLDPVASGIFAGLTSLFTLLVIFVVIRKIFSDEVALIACLIWAVSSSLINFDRVQGPVNFIPPFSLLILYFLYKFLTGNLRYVFLLAAAVGFAFHTHFTAVFYPLIIFCCLPLFPRKKPLSGYLPLALAVFILFLTPNIIHDFQSKASGSRSLINYLGTYYHGLHLVRVIQLTKDAFIEFENFLFPQIKFLKYLLLPLFLIISLILSSFKKQSLILGYLFSLWFLIPWLIFSVYSGEISNYYFSINLPIALIIIAFLTWQIFKIKGIAFKILITGFWLYFALINVQNFFNTHPLGLRLQKEAVQKAIKAGQKIEFKQGAPQSYLYYIYTRNK